MDRENVRHGECVLIAVSELPKNSQQLETVKEMIVAHSESGHHHVVVADGIVNYSLDIPSIRKMLTNTLYGHADITALIELKSDGELKHLKSSDKHETKPLSKGFFVIVQKNAWNYFKKLQEKVRD